MLMVINFASARNAVAGAAAGAAAAVVSADAVAVSIIVKDILALPVQVRAGSRQFIAKARSKTQQ